MLFEEIFLEKADLQKFQMFRALSAFDARNLTITDLSVKMHLSYQQSYSIFQELIADISQVTGKSRAASKKALTTPSLLNVSVDDYRYFLLKDAIAFQFVDYLLQGNRPTSDRFCAQRYISRSTLLRKTQPLRKFLTQYQLKLSLTKACFTGDEMQVRLFYQAVYWLGCHGTIWPFQSISLETIRRQYAALPKAKQNPIEAAQERLLWAISRIRLARGHAVGDTSRIDALLKDCPGFEKTIYSTAQFPNVTADVLASENSFFHFYQVKTIQFAPLTPTDTAFCQYLKKAPGPMWPVIERLSDYLKAYVADTDSCTPRLDLPLTLNIMRCVMSFYLLNGDYIKQGDFYQPPTLTYQQAKLHKVLGDFVDQLPDSELFRALKLAKESFTKLLFYLLVPYLSHFAWDNTVHVLLLIEMNDLLNRKLTDFLDDIHIVTRMQGDAPIQQADLVITAFDDFLEPQTTDFIKAHPNRVFNWYLNATDLDYARLYEKIHTLYANKLIPAQ